MLEPKEMQFVRHELHYFLRLAWKLNGPEFSS